MIKCFKCSKQILPNSKYISLNTFDNGKLIHSAHFHFNCWGLFNDEKIQERLRNMTSVGLGFLNERLKN